MRQIYLDHNATTPMEQGAVSALLHHSFASPGPSSTGEQLATGFANPSSIHRPGRVAARVVDESRQAIASALGVCDPEEILFTSCATESINTALKGFVRARRAAQLPARLLLAPVEHDATLESARSLESEGAHIDWLPVDAQGLPDLDALRRLLRSSGSQDTLVSMMAANNETGVILPWKEAAQLSREAGAFFHLDAVQAPGKVPGFSLREAEVDLASFSAHKIGGPKGVGALVVSRKLSLHALLHGGAQERRRRAGTLNVAGVAAFATAASELPSWDLAGIDGLRARLETMVCARIAGCTVLGGRAPRMVNTSCLLFEEVRGEGLVMGLDLEGFAVSSGSACNSGSILPSHVLLAMGLDTQAARSAVRVSLGRRTSPAELDQFVDALERVVARIRGIRKDSGGPRG